jgi:hypothetical protein
MTYHSILNKSQGPFSRFLHQWALKGARRPLLAIAILLGSGAILGGGKGAAIGGSIGAASGTAMVMAGDRNPAVLPAGANVTVRLHAPVTIAVER